MLTACGLAEETARGNGSYGDVVAASAEGKSLKGQGATRSTPKAVFERKEELAKRKRTL